MVGCVTYHWLLHSLMARVLSTEDGEGAEGDEREGRGRRAVRGWGGCGGR